ncbi:MAG: hypothetical protein GY944_02270 [bacterium]|nr:hypothetical protein [bacterium]
MRVEYLTEGDSQLAAAPLLLGEAGFVYAGADGNLVSELRMRLSANTTHALLGHGVVAALNELPLQGRLGSGMQVLIPPRALDSACGLFYRADEKTYGRRYEFVLGTAHGGQIEYRIRIDNREYQHSLSELQFLLRTAAHEGMAAWLQI